MALNLNQSMNQEDHKEDYSYSEASDDELQSSLDNGGEPDNAVAGPSNSNVETESENKDVKNFENLKKEVAKYYTNKLTHLTDEQWMILEYGVKYINDSSFRSKNSNVVFIDGPVGSGKTEVGKILCDYAVKRRGPKSKRTKRYAVFVSSYGVSALNYSDGRTAHSKFGFPMYLKDDKSFWNLDASDENDWKYKIEPLQDSDVIVYDEISSVDYRYINMLDRSLRQTMNSKCAFGGKFVILVGDFRQVAPVDENTLIDKKDPILAISPIPLFYPSATPYSTQPSLTPLPLKFFYLTTYQRTSTDKNYTDFLKNVGLGQVEGIKHELIRDMKYIPLPKTVRHTTVLDDIITHVFPEEILRAPDSATKRAILVPRYMEAKKNNNYILQFIPGEVQHCYAINDPVTQQNLQECELILDSFQGDKVFPDNDLQLKPGVLCMIIRGMHKPKTLVIGEKVVVVKILDDFIEVRKPGKNANVTKHTFQLKREKFETKIRLKSKLITTTRIQFPLKVCYATTIHKSQGQTLDRAALDLRMPSYYPAAIFCHGQLHLALGRVKKAAHIMVLVNEKDVDENGTAYTHNLVYPEIIHQYVGNAEDVPKNDIKEENVSEMEVD